MFVSKAQETFAAYPFVNYRVLDIEKNPSQQNFSAQSFDIVIAANVLHATADLNQALENVQTLLRPEGLLLLLEATRALRFTDLIVGLTEGWWRFTDKEIRSSHALLSEEKWRELLSARGFRQRLAMEFGRVADHRLPLVCGSVWSTPTCDDSRRET